LLPNAGLFRGRRGGPSGDVRARLGQAFERGDAAILVRRALADGRVSVQIAAKKPETLAAFVDAYLAEPAWKRSSAS
jgi:hypothetical protein